MSDEAARRDPAATEDGIGAEAGGAVPLTSRAAGVRRVLLLSGRLVAGLAGVAVAVVAVAAAGLVPWPSVALDVPVVVVSPEPADAVRVCPGGALRLGEESGQDAGTPVPIAEAAVTAGAAGSEFRSRPLPASDAGTGDTSAAPVVLELTPVEGALLGGAQSQRLAARDFAGFTASGCAEPSGSIWLVGGATSVGRSTLLTLSNPTGVAATVDIVLYGESGRISAPGLAGIDVPAGTQRILSLAGFSPGLVSPVVHVEARGGQVVAALQHSIVRGLAATGVETVGAAGDPATAHVIPGVRVVDTIGVNRALALADWEDVAPVLRLLAPGDEPATVRVGVLPGDPGQEGASFEVELDPGEVAEIPLDAGETATGHGLEDGLYTVTIESDAPVVAAARVSTAVDAGVDPAPDAVPDAPSSDVAWFVPAEPLRGDALVAVAAGPSPVLSARNATDEDVTLVLEGGDVPDRELVVPAGGSASVSVVSGATYVARGSEGLAIAISYAGAGLLAGYALVPARPVAGPITVRPG